ncbi:F-box and associated interaction domain protein [Medicago truncatula]|uniref:F-box and associated interaction domain protein n=2 Tax=Medicago truncatula TaxID=3880 RepID=G7ZWB3_MEDTR|nr:F-box and associated interaction domain protein [Medicago truncatula]KEH37784.1 F-box and associated interaction domain protein [Medicago truncatula]
MSWRKINVLSSVTLSEELIIEILSLLKVKPLIRFKCVSKSWYSLISNPFFIKKHLFKSSQNPHLSIFATNSSGNSIDTTLAPLPIQYLHEITDVNDITRYTDKEYHEVVGCCNGLICLLYISSINNDYEYSFGFWNPATRSSSVKLGSFLISDKEHDSHFHFSLGYDNLTAKHKLVGFRTNEVRVFTLGDNVWRNIQCFPSYPSHWWYVGWNCGVYFNNSLNWFAYQNNVCWNHHLQFIEQFVIISLDLGMETYTQMLLPQDFDEVHPHMPMVCVLMDCLCFSHHSDGYNFVIWKMREFAVEESWIKLLKFSYQLDFSAAVSLFPLHVFQNGDTLIYARYQEQVIYYNRRDNAIDQTRTTDKIHRFFKLSNITSQFLPNHYVESLVSTC